MFICPVVTIHNDTGFVSATYMVVVMDYVKHEVFNFTVISD